MEKTHFEEILYPLTIVFIFNMGTEFMRELIQIRTICRSEINCARHIIVK